MHFDSLRSALGGLVTRRQWFVWRLDWDATEHKYRKLPCDLSGQVWPISAQDPVNWRDFDAAAEAVTHLGFNADRTVGHALGFYLTADCGYWFLDIDKCVSKGQLSPIAQSLVGLFPGCAVEWSSSQQGLHIFGRGTPPEHVNRNKDYKLELYVRDRGVAFGFGEMTGSADTEHPQALAHLVSHFFPPRPLSAMAGDLLPATGPRPDWKGPTDDAELLQMMLRSKSAGAQFGTRASFADLWNNNTEVLDRVYGTDSESERDAALLQHLAFWTGCDRQRMYDLAAQSRLARDKWWTRRKDTDYLGYSIGNAVDKQQEVYCQREREVPTDIYAPTSADAPLIQTQQAGAQLSPEILAQCDRLLDMVGEATDVGDVHNRIIPAVRSAQLPAALLVRIERAVNTRLALWDAALPIAKLRALLNPPLAAKPDADAPPFVTEHVYVINGDKFFRLHTGEELSRQGFTATYNRMMPFRESGIREDAAQWALERWEMPVVSATMYRPGYPSVFAWEGQHWANKYSPSSIPVVAACYSDLGVRGINLFVRHIEVLMDGRPELVRHLFDFIAHNVQFPGVKIRHCPIIKGIEGDGKSIIANVFGAALGWRNVMPVGPETVNNSGGFTDWAHGSAITCFEELMITGRDRFKVSNIIKPFITNDVVSINPKGAKQIKVMNTSNQIAFTNFNDAIPISIKDRRWLVIFTPFNDLDDLRTVLGVENLQRDHFEPMFTSLQQCPGEWRKYFLDYPISKDFNPHTSAMLTDEKQLMGDSGLEDAELVARDIVENGAFGISADVLSSSCLSAQLAIRSKLESFDLPRTSALSHMLTRLGFAQGRPMKWNGQTHRVWIRGNRKMGADAVREALEATRPKTD